MQKDRRSFLKKSAVVAGTAVVAGSVSAMAKSDVSGDSATNGVVLGNSPKKEILYRKTAEWTEYYKQAL